MLAAQALAVLPASWAGRGDRLLRRWHRVTSRLLLWCETAPELVWPHSRVSQPSACPSGHLFPGCSDALEAVEGSGQVSAALNTKSTAERISHNSARSFVSLTKAVKCFVLLVYSGKADMGCVCVCLSEAGC